jgi:hypothetical protein
VVVFVLLIVGVYLYFQTSVTTGGDYSKELEAYCEVETRLLIKKVVCKGFMTRELQPEENQRCFWLLVYDGEESLEEFKFCEETNLVEWENPYEDYERNIPVTLEVITRKSLWGASDLKNVRFILMEDQEAIDIMRTLPEDRGLGSIPLYLKEAQEILDKGYYITSPIGMDTRDRLVLYDAEIEEISVEREEIVLSINTELYGEELTLLIRTEDFLFFEPEVIEEEDGILIDVEGIDAFDQDGSFFVAFDTNFEEEKVEEYLNSLLEVEGEINLAEEFKLVEIVAKEI